MPFLAPQEAAGAFLGKLRSKLMGTCLDALAAFLLGFVLPLEALNTSRSALDNTTEATYA